MSPVPPSSPGRRAPLPRPPEEQRPVAVPPALLPPKKRWVLLSRKAPEATVPVPTAPPVVVPQILATPAVAGAMNPLAAAAPTPAPQVDSNATSSPPAAVLKQPPPLAGDQKPHAPRPPVRRLVPKGTTKSAAAARKGNKVASASVASVKVTAAGASRRLEAVADEDEREPGEFVPDEELAVDRNNNAAAARQSSLLAGGEPAAEMKLVSSNGEAERHEVETMSARQKRTREVFVGGLYWDAKEDDVRAALEEAGEITEVGIIIDGKTTKNRGYCFVQYREAAQARKAIAELGGVKICGKQCRIEALEGSGQVKIAQKDPTEENTHTYSGQRKRPLSTLVSYIRWHNLINKSLPFVQMRQSGSRKPGQPHGSRH